MLRVPFINVWIVNPRQFPTKSANFPDTHTSAQAASGYYCATHNAQRGRVVAASTMSLLSFPHELLIANFFYAAFFFCFIVSRQSNSILIKNLLRRGPPASESVRFNGDDAYIYVRL